MYRPCKQDDIWRIRNFLQETYQLFPEKVNWHIDRLNFTYSMSRSMNGVEEKLYRKRIAIFEDSQGIVSVVNTEGENRGEVFFQIRDFNIDEQVLNDMFEFAEQTSPDIHLRISSKAEQILNFAIERGYIEENWSEITCSMPLTKKLDSKLPHGFVFGKPSCSEKAKGHSYAFGYHGNEDLLKKSEIGLKNMETMPDYKQDLDISIVTEEGQVAAFATMWFDTVNKIGILEPVGTVENYRKLGLAKCAIYEACNRILQLGAKKVYVGSDQEFYKKIGFTYASEDKVFKQTKKS